MIRVSFHLTLRAQELVRTVERGQHGSNSVSFESRSRDINILATVHLVPR
jgi:hypothetical protein